nr:methyl-cpg-binding domain-containing protein 8 [Ipomoea batatas]GMD11205.1 methyl-cpg-binding domain-containing protein 8 [Ipomoea batatas]
MESSKFLSLSANQNDDAAEILSEGTNDNNLVDVQVQGEYECDICKMIFHELTEYAQHRKFHRETLTGYQRWPRGLTDGAIIKDGKYGCQFCPKVFDTKVSYSRHLRPNGTHSAEINMLTEMNVPIEVEPIAGIAYYGMDPTSGVRDEADSRVQDKAAFDEQDEDDELGNLRLLSEVSVREE